MKKEMFKNTRENMLRLMENVDSTFKRKENINENDDINYYDNRGEYLSDLYPTLKQYAPTTEKLYPLLLKKKDIEKLVDDYIEEILNELAKTIKNFSNTRHPFTVVDAANMLADFVQQNDEIALESDHDELVSYYADELRKKIKYGL